MARLIGPKCRYCRRAGEKLGIRNRCTTTKCALTKRNYPPGQHGQQSRHRTSGFGLQLREKQKAKLIYGLLERQFRAYYERAIRKTGNTSEIFMRLLEMRLDTVVYRLGFAVSRNHARQLIQHRHIVLNGRVVTIPSFRVSVGDRIALSEKQSAAILQDLEKSVGARTIPGWLVFDAATKEGRVLSLPASQDLKQGIEMQLIVEYYSR